MTTYNGRPPREGDRPSQEHRREAQQSQPRDGRRQSAPRDEKPRRWFRDSYADAVWAADGQLTANEKLVALVYANHAGADDKPEDRPESDTAWVTWARMAQQTGIKSRDAINRAIRGLEDKKWLDQLEPPAGHLAPVYRLLIPLPPAVREADPCDRQQSVSRTPSRASSTRDGLEGSAKQTPRGTADVPNSSTELLNVTPVVALLGAQPQDARVAGVDDETWTLAQVTAWAGAERPDEAWRLLVRRQLASGWEPADLVQELAYLGESVPIPRRSGAVTRLLKRVRKPRAAPAGSATRR